MLCSYLKDKAQGGCRDQRQREGEREDALKREREREEKQSEYPVQQKDWTLSIQRLAVQKQTPSGGVRG